MLLGVWSGKEQKQPFGLITLCQGSLEVGFAKPKKKKKVLSGCFYFYFYFSLLQSLVQTKMLGAALGPRAGGTGPFEHLSLPPLLGPEDWAEHWLKRKRKSVLSLT